MLNDKESGRITYRQFANLYQAYKDNFDYELYLTLSRKTYGQIKKEAEESEEWV